MVVALDVVGQAGQHVPQRGRPFVRVQHERVHATQGHLGDHADRAHPDECGGEQVRVLLAGAAHDLTSAGDQLQFGDERGQAAVPLAGAVRAGGERAGDRLHVDVAEVGHGQTVPGEFGVERGEPSARLHPDQLRRSTERHQPRETGEIQSCAGSRRSGGERVAGADRLHRAARGGGGPDGGDHFVRRGRPGYSSRNRLLVPGPVVPGQVRILTHEM